MVVLSSFDHASPAHIRNLVRRLRRKAPALPVVIGLWNAEGPVLEALGRTARADHVVRDLREALRVALDTAHPPADAETAPARSAGGSAG
jgi:hypothetical protein